MDELDLGQTIRGFVAGQRVFQRYVLKSILGRGGMGIVWRAFDEHLERDVALKFLPELIIHDRAVLDDLKRETKRNLDLTHHHIVRIYDFAQDSSSACISMEFVDGETLSALRVDRPEKVFQADELAQHIAQLCEALIYAHTIASIVHRDLKPANLMLNSKGVLKITDFGIARSLSDSISMLTMNRSVSGTLLYMSPQQLDGERASPLDDIYSVGATIYELLTSKPPFYSGAVERQIHEKTPPAMSSRRSDLGIVSSSPIPEHWEQTVADCLAKDPARRPQSAVILAERLRGISNTPPVPPSLSEPTPAVIATPAPGPVHSGGSQRPTPRSGLLYAIGIGGMILLAGLLYIGLRSTKNIANQEREILTPAPSATQFSDPASSPVDTPPVSAITPFSPTATDTPPSNSAIQQSASYSSSDGYDPGIGFVDMNRIFKEYSKTKDSEKTINEAKDAAKREYDIRAAAYTKLLDEINRLNAQDESLNAAAKVAKAKERVEKIATIKNTEKEINEFRTAREKELQDLAVQMRTELVRDITREIASLYSISTSKGILYDRSAYSLNGVPIVTFSPDRADMSDKVISALNQKTRSAFTLAHDLVFGVVDMNRIFKSYNKTKDAEAQINAAKLAAKKEYDQRSDSHKAALEAANKAPAAERDEKIRKVKSMEKEINEFRETRERQLQEQALKLRAGIVKEITDAIGQGIGRTSGAVIIDISGPGASGTPITMFNSGVPDYSEDVIAALNGSAAVKFHASLLSSKKLRFGVIDMNRAFKSWPGPKPDEAASDAATDATRKKELQEAATKMRQDIVANIGSALKAIASREKFNLVFDSSGNSMNGVPITLLTPGIPDLTDKVLQK